jgi:glutamate N-acetyltransferase/amino-acid N-acetyltransferase
MNLARMMARDGEGATKLIECVCTGAQDDKTAAIVAKSVITSSLFKAAIFGEDANWGRILCAVGYAPADFDIHKVDVTLASAKGKIEVCKNGAGLDFSEEFAKEVLSEEEIGVLVTIGDGAGSAVAWGCDLTYDYVRINGDYRS